MQWAHAPVHQFQENGTIIVTAGTYHKQHLFNSPQRLDLLQNTLFELADRADWKLQAWSFFSNHYHFIAHTPAESGPLANLIQRLHSLTAREINQMDGTPGRTVWFEYWDTNLTFRRSYLARLKYVTWNPVEHGLVEEAIQYPWCSAGWLEQRASPSIYKSILSFKTDAVNVPEPW